MNRKSILILALIAISISSFTLALPLQKKFDLKASMERGKEIFISSCVSCHGVNGEGIEGVFPPIAKSDYLMADTKRSIQQILYGLEGEIKVNGVIYNNMMPGFQFSDEETSDVLNYIRNSFGNKGKPVLPAEVKEARKKQDAK